MRQVLVPEWIFESDDYFLVGLEPNGRVCVDGGHSKPAGVAEAQRLYESISAIRKDSETKWVMIKVDRVPEFEGKINQEAIDTLNHVTGRAAGRA